MIHVNLKKVAALVLNPTSPWFFLTVAAVLAGSMVYTYVPTAFLMSTAKVVCALAVLVSTIIDFISICAEMTSVKEREGCLAWFRYRIITMPLQGFMMNFVVPIDINLLVKLLVLWTCLLTSRSLYMHKVLKKGR